MSDIIDRHEDVSLMEPLLIGESSKYRTGLSDLTIELAMKSMGLKKSLPKSIIKELSTLVRSMNCYYSNLIEGHNTHPVDIEKALKGDYSSNHEVRNLQLEAKAHIIVQKWIDEEGLGNNAFTKRGIKEIHKRFCDLLPDDLLKVVDPKTNREVKVISGEFRLDDVQVGHLVPISPGAINRFLDRFEKAYAKVGKTDTILAAATAHHRFLYIHPFLDGNGRVARLMSYAVLNNALDAGGIWSIARGLARNVSTYKKHLAACDLKRRNDFDGRGNLSEEALAQFTEFFLQTCIDQVNFMESLVRPDKLKNRIVKWAKEEIEQGNLPKDSEKILEAILYRGELQKSEAAEVISKTDRQTRRVTSALTEKGVITSENLRSPFHLSFPAELAFAWMPGLFPEQ